MDTSLRHLLSELEEAGRRNDEQEIAEYLAAVEALTQFDHLVIPIGKGLSIAYRQKG